MSERVTRSRRVFSRKVPVQALAPGRIRPRRWRDSEDGSGHGRATRSRRASRCPKSRAATGGCAPLAGAAAGHRSRGVDHLRPLQDPARGGAAGQHRSAPRRASPGPFVAASCPTQDPRWRKRSRSVAFDRIDLRDGAALERDRPYLVPLIEQLALPGDVRGQDQPEELDRPTRRVHARDH